ncbi:ankyrin repeat domain-containing protein [Planctomycetota bacterium]
MRVTSHFCTMVGLILILNASLTFSTEAEESGVIIQRNLPAPKRDTSLRPYAVVVDANTLEHPEWGQVVEALKKKYNAKVFVAHYPEVGTVRKALNEYMPWYVCFVAEPEQATREMIEAAAYTMTWLDDDPYEDAVWAVLTGFVAEDALRIVNAEPLVVRKELSNVWDGWLDWLEEGVSLSSDSDYKFVKNIGGVKQQLEGPKERTPEFVEILNQDDCDIITTAAHASEHVFLLGYPNTASDGRITHNEEGDIYGIDTQGKIHDINMSKPKIYYSPGNCLIGHIDGPSCLSLAWMHNGANAFFGHIYVQERTCYTWAIAEYFMALQGQYTFAEATYAYWLALRFSVDELPEAYPCCDRDGKGTVLYGDPAWEARVKRTVMPAYSQDLDIEYLAHGRIKITAGITIHRKWEPWVVPGVRPVILLPFRIREATIEKSDVDKVGVADSFILLDLGTRSIGGNSFPVGTQRSVVLYARKLRVWPFLSDDEVATRVREKKLDNISRCIDFLTDETVDPNERIKKATMWAKNYYGHTPLDMADLLNNEVVSHLLVSRDADMSVLVAVRYRLMEEIKKLIERGADVNAKDNEGQTPLYAAIWSGDANMVELLLDKGANMKIKDSYGQTPLDVAVRYSQKDILKLLVARGAEVPSIQVAAFIGDLSRVKAFLGRGIDINAKDTRNRTALHYASNEGQKEVVELLLANGADVNAGTEYNKTAAEFAMSRGHTAIVKLLISKGADISPLHLALCMKNEAKARSLIEAGADVNKRTPYGTTPLDMAVCAGFKNIAKLLIDKGADVNAKDNWDWTPLHSVAGDGYKDIVELLMAHGANVNARDGDRRTPLYYAKEKGHTEIVELLRKHGAKLTDQIQSLRKAVADRDIAQVKSLLSKGIDVNGKDETGDTPLHYAAELTTDASKDVCELLIARGASASVNAKNKVGWTPLHEAGESGNLEVVRLLIANGADVNARDNSGRTPLSLAAAGGQTEITELLNRHIRVPSPKEASFADTAPDLILTPETSIAPQDFGCWVDCADVNGDGYDDCLVSSGHYNNDQGRVYLYYGGPGMDDRPDKVFNYNTVGDLFGISVALGDVNGDGFADVIIGAIRYNNKQGRIFIYYGGSDMDTNPDVILEGEPGTSGIFGRVIDAADIDRDGYADVVVNALGYGSEAGRAYLYYGGNPMDTVPAKIFDGENPADMYGREMDMGGDVNGDGYGDIIFGCRAWNNLRGRAYLHYGGPPDSMDSICDRIFTGESAGDEFGSSVCLFDVDKDGYADVMIGARKYSKYTPRSYEGRMYMYWGGPHVNLNADLVFEGERGVGSCFGGDSIKCGHFNGDSYADIVVSAWGYRTSQGQVCLYYGGSRASMDTVCDRTFTGEMGTEASMYGVRNAVGDFNGDKRSDLLVGAPWYPSGNRLGRAYVYYTKPFPPGNKHKVVESRQQVPTNEKETQP